MRFFVVPEQLRGGDALDLGVKMRKEVRMAQQHPVEKENVVDLHDIEDDEVAREKRAEGKLFLMPSHAARTAAPRNSSIAKMPRHQPRICAPRKRSAFLSGTAAKTSRGAEEKNFFS